jgi:hypothetical protein
MTMQELLKIQAEQTKKNTSALQVHTQATQNLSLDVKKLSEQNVKAANDEEFKKKREEQVTESLTKLNATLKEAIKNGLGAAVGKKLEEDNSLKSAAAGKSSGLRQFLLGGKKGEEVQSKSIFGVTSFIDKQLTKREDKKALKQEKEQFVEDAMKHDPTIYARKANFAGGMKTEEGRTIAKAEAEKRFDTIKEKEAAVTKVHAKIEDAQAAGFAPLKKDLEERDKATGELAKVDTRLQAAIKEEPAVDTKKPRRATKKEIKDNVIDVEAKDVTSKPRRATKKEIKDNVIDIKSKEISHTQIEEEKEKSSKLSAENIKANTEQVNAEHEIGKTLSLSLDIQKQQLAALTKMSESGGGGGGPDAGGPSAVDTALDIAGNLPGKEGGKAAGKAGGKSLGSKAARFLKGGGGRLLGSVAAVGMGAYEAYSGWQDANAAEGEQNQAIDARVAKGEISEADAKKMKTEVSDKTDVKKGEAVGGGVGGAGGALAGAAAGAAIGSVVPVVGTAIGGLVGGALGYYGGSKVGEKVGGALTSGYKSIKGFFGGGDDKKKDEVKPDEIQKMSLDDLQKFKKQTVKDGPTIPGDSDSQEMFQTKLEMIDRAIDQKQNEGLKKGMSSSVTPGPSSSGENLQTASKSNEELKTSKSGANTNVVNAPSTTINNNGGGKTDIRTPPRNQDSSVSKYIDTRY